MVDHVNDLAHFHKSRLKEARPPLVASAVTEKGNALESEQPGCVLAVKRHDRHAKRRPELPDPDLANPDLR
jgi:hypothetical protein